MKSWLQIRGDPAIRRFLFDQERVDNDFDRQSELIAARATQLVRAHGVFHIKLHFSSGQVTLWLLEDPLRYRVHLKEEFLSGDFCLAYPQRGFPTDALIAPEAVERVFDEFERLRRGDNHVYLRAGSLNIMNGKVGLNFSCDGSHYLDCADFLAGGRELFVTD